MRALTVVAALACAAAVSGCVGAAAPGPAYGYGQPYPAPYQQAPVQQGYEQPRYEQPQGYAPAPQQVALGERCFAGVYTCALPQALPVGAQCSCPGLGAPSYGNVR